MNDEANNSEKPSKEVHTHEFAKQLALLHAHLLEAGIARIRVDYEANEGVGGFSIEAFDAAAKRVTKRLDTSLIMEVTGFLLRLIERRHPKWYECAGASARVDWGLATNKLQHCHHQREVFVKTSEHHGL